MSSMISNFPDILKCKGSDNKENFYLLYLSIGESYNPEDITTTYRMHGSETHKVIDFYTKTGLYKSANTDDSLLCHGKSINELYQEGRAFNLVTSKEYNSNLVLINGFPDALICSDDYVSDGAIQYLYFFHKVEDDGSVIYAMNVGVLHEIVFDKDGQYKSSHQSWYASRCKYKSIDSLYSEGMAFNLVSSKNQGVDSILRNGFPDAIKCSTMISDFVYIVSNIDEDGSVRYVRYSPDEYYVIFDKDGNYQSSNTGYSYSCESKSISTMYSDGEAFNLVSYPSEESSCRVSNFHDNQYLQGHFFEYWDPLKQDDGSFYISIPGVGYLVNNEGILGFSTELTASDNQYWFIIKDPESGNFRVQSKSTGKYMELKDGSILIDAESISDNSIWSITGACDFIANHEYVKFKSELDLIGASRCQTKVMLGKVELIGSPINTNQDIVNLTIGCDNQHISSSKNFTIESSVYEYDEQVVVCDNETPFLGLNLTVSNKTYGLSIPRDYFLSYPIETELRYKVSEEELNTDKVHVVTLNRESNVNCTTVGNILADIDMQSKVNDICGDNEEILNNFNHFSFISDAFTFLGDAISDVIGVVSPEFKTAIGESIIAICRKHLGGNFDTEALAAQNFQAICEDHFKSEDNILVEKLCITSGSSYDLESSLDFDWDAFSDVLLTQFGMNVDSIFTSSLEGCTNVDIDPKYKVDIIVSTDNKPYCWSYQDYMFPKTQNVTLALDCKEKFWDDDDNLKDPQEKCAIGLNITEYLDSDVSFIEFTQVESGNLYNGEELLGLETKYHKDDVQELEYVVAIEDCPSTGCTFSEIAYKAYSDYNTFSHAHYQVLVSYANDIMEMSLFMLASALVVEL